MCLKERFCKKKNDVVKDLMVLHFIYLMHFVAMLDLGMNDEEPLFLTMSLIFHNKILITVSLWIETMNDKKHFIILKALRTVYTKIVEHSLYRYRSIKGFARCNQKAEGEIGFKHFNGTIYK